MSDPRAKTHLEFEMLHDERPLRIEAARGSKPTLMVSFTSVGQERDKWPPKEFVGLASQNGQNHVMCITDISRCWMNGPGMKNVIVEQVARYVQKNNIERVMAIGISMGAYNALMLGRMMQLERVIAFTPQYSVHPDVMPDEKRWWYFRKQIKRWPYKEMNRLPRTPAQIYMFHGDTPDERMHWERFPTSKNLRHYIFGAADHTFVTKLKGAHTLRNIVVAAINNKPGRMGKVVGRAGGMRREDYHEWEAASKFFEGRREAGRPEGLKT